MLIRHGASPALSAPDGQTPLGLALAALSMNLSMTRLQDTLAEQTTPLTDAQRAQVDTHAARQAIASDRAPEAFKMLARISRIFEQLNNAWDVLRTMTPSDYSRFRDSA